MTRYVAASGRGQLAASAIGAEVGERDLGAPAKIVVERRVLRAGERAARGEDRLLARVRERLGDRDDLIVVLVDAWSASRALLLWDVLDPYSDVRDGGKLSMVLGNDAVEVLVMKGQASDLARLEPMLARLPI